MTDLVNNYGLYADAGGKVIQVTGQYVEGNASIYVNLLPLQRNWVVPQNFCKTVDLNSIVDRQKELTQLSQWLIQQERSRLHVVALTGFPGTGKTSLAAQFSEKHRHDHFQGVLWVNLSAKPEREYIQGILNEWAAFAFGGSLEQNDIEGTSKTYHFDKAAVRELLTQQDRLLCVIDDVFGHEQEARELIEALPMGSGVILITTYEDIARSIAGDAILNLGMLTHQEAIQLLRRSLPNVIESTLHEIAEASGKHPQELEFAAGQLASFSGEALDIKIQEMLERRRLGVNTDKPNQILADTYHEIAKQSPEFAHYLMGLGIIGKNQLEFSSETASAVWQVDLTTTVRFLRLLKSRSFVMSVGEQQEEWWILPVSLQLYAYNQLIESGNLHVFTERYLDFFYEMIKGEMTSSQQSDLNRLRENLSHIEYVIENYIIKNIENNIGRAAFEEKFKDDSQLLFDLAQTLSADWTLTDRLLHWLPKAARCIAAFRDSLANEDQSNQQDTSIAIQLWFLYFALQRNLFQIHQAENGLDEALKLATKWKILEAESWIYISKAQLNLGASPTLAISNLSKGLTIAQKSNFFRAEITARKMLGDIYVAENQFDKAQSNYESALSLAEANQASKIQQALLADLGEMFAKNAKYNQAIECFKKSVTLSRSKNDVSFQIETIHLYRRIAQVHQDIGTFDEALFAIAEAFSLISRYGLEKTGLQAHVLLQRTKIHTLKEEFELAETLVQNVKDIARELQNQLIDGEIQESYGFLELSKGNMEKASAHYLEAIEIWKGLKNQPRYLDVCTVMASINARQGKLGEALKYYREVWEEIFALGNQKQIAKLTYEIGILFLWLGDFIDGSVFLSQVKIDARQMGYRSIEIISACWEIILRKNITPIEVILPLFEELPSDIDQEEILTIDEQIVTLYSLGIVNNALGKHQTARHLFDASLDLISETDQPATEAHILLSLTETYENVEDIETAIHFANRALPLAKRLRDWPLESALHLSLSRYYFSQANYDRAVEEIEATLALLEYGDPSKQQWQAYLMEADIQNSLNNQENALAALEKAGQIAEFLNDDPSRAITHFRKGTLLFMEFQEHDKGLQEIDQATRILEANANQNETLRNMSRIFWILREYMRSTVSADALQELLINFLKVNSWENAQLVLDADRGQLLLSDRAIRALENLRSSIPESTHSAARRAVSKYIEFIRICKKEGIANGVRKIRTSKDNHPLYYWWGAQFRANQDYGEGLNLLNRALLLQPEEPTYLIERGWIYRSLGTYKTALQDFESAISKSQSSTAYLGLGVVKFEMGQYADAIRDFDTALEESNKGKIDQINIAYICQWRACAYFAASLTDEKTDSLSLAHEDLARAIQIDSHESSHYFWRAIIRISMGELDLARKDLNEATQLVQTWPEKVAAIHCWLGIIELLRNKPPEEQWIKAKNAIGEIGKNDIKSVRLLFLSVVQGNREALDQFDQTFQGYLNRSSRHTFGLYIHLLSNLLSNRPDHLELFTQLRQKV